MQLQCALQDEHIMVTSDAGVLEIEPEILNGNLRLENG